jgi:hypothetical protein
MIDQKYSYLDLGFVNSIFKYLVFFIFNMYNKDQLSF